MSRTDVNSVLKDEARGSSGLAIGKMSRVLVTAEVALSLVLLAGAGLMLQSFWNLVGVDIGIERLAYPIAKLVDPTPKHLWHRPAILRPKREIMQQIVGEKMFIHTAKQNQHYVEKDCAKRKTRCAAYKSAQNFSKYRRKRDLSQQYHHGIHRRQDRCSSQPP